MTSPTLSESGGCAPEDADIINAEKEGEDWRGPNNQSQQTYSAWLIADNTPALYLNEREDLDRCTPY